MGISSRYGKNLLSESFLRDTKLTQKRLNEVYFKNVETTKTFDQNQGHKSKLLEP